MLLINREAANGYNLCKVCAFENFKASLFCMICGEKIALDEPEDDAAGVEVHLKNGASITNSIATTQLTQRQIRARCVHLVFYYLFHLVTRGLTRTQSRISLAGIDLYCVESAKSGCGSWTSKARCSGTASK